MSPRGPGHPDPFDSGVPYGEPNWRRSCWRCVRLEERQAPLEARVAAQHDQIVAQAAHIKILEQQVERYREQERAYDALAGKGDDRDDEDEM